MSLTKRFMVAAAFVASLGVARPAHAQLGFTFYGVGEWDTEDVTLALGGVSVALNRLGWSPTAGLQAFWLQYPAGTEQDQITGITPSVGLRNLFHGGFIEGRVGYTFTSRDDDFVGPIGAPVADVEDGVSTALHFEYWGIGALGAQAIATYNFGAETLWTRGRLTYPLLGLGEMGQLRIGGEVAYLYAAAAEEFFGAEDFSQVAAGGVLGFNPGRGVIINGRVGRKFGDADATYFGVELVLTPQ